MTQSLHYEYADGSANRYVISKSTVEFIPVRPEESSTGMYDGGEPKVVDITAEQFETFRDLFEKAIHSTDDHIEDRVKMSGIVLKVQDGELSRYILKPKSTVLVEIETALTEVMKD